MSLVTEYKCPNCGAALAFDPSSSSVKCDHCGHSFDVANIVKSQEVEGQNEEFNWDRFNGMKSLENFEGTSVYQCQSCGAILETDENTVATKCPYCDNNVVITDRVSKGLKPNALIPFAIDKKQIPDLLMGFYKKKKLLPKSFFTERIMEKAQGIYVPFWLFDASITGKAKFKGTVVTTQSTSKERITTTHDYLLIREGDLSFTHIPVDASTKMDNDLMDSIEPYDYSKLVPFDGAYLSGFVADRFDSDPDAELPRANGRMTNTLIAQLRNTAIEYAPVLFSSDVRLKNADVNYVFLPVYVLNCEYKGKKYRYAINGQTGKVVGEVPKSVAKGTGRFFSAFGIAAVITFILCWFVF